MHMVFAADICFNFVEISFSSALNFQQVLVHYTESSKYYAQPQTAVARGLDLPTRGLAGRQTAPACKHSLCYFSLFSEKTVTRIDVHLQSGNISVY